jgi:glycerol-3-phosphate acyltransferase PlsY
MLPAILLIAAAAYLLGSIPIGYLLVRFFRQQDIRSVGSGNIGATNVLRYGGKSLGAVTFLLDVLKGSSAVFLGALLAAHFAPALTATHKPWPPSSPSWDTSSPSGSVSTAAKA